jgi:hypothetical protein
MLLSPPTPLLLNVPWTDCSILGEKKSTLGAWAANDKWSVTVTAKFSRSCRITKLLDIEWSSEVSVIIHEGKSVGVLDGTGHAYRAEGNFMELWE